MKRKLSKILTSSALVIIFFFFSGCSNSPGSQEKENLVIASLAIPAIHVSGTQLSQDFQKYDSLEIIVDTTSVPPNPATYHVYGYFTSPTGLKKDDISSHFPAQGQPITVSGGFSVMPIKCLGKGSTAQPNPDQQNYYLIPIRVSVNGPWYLAFNINTSPNGTPGSTLKRMNPCPPDHPSLE